LTEPAPPPSSLPGPRLELNRPRDLNALLTDSFSLYRRHFWTLLAVAFVVVVPVHAVVLGVGLGQFSGGFDSTPAPASTLVPGLTRLLVVRAGSPASRARCRRGSTLSGASSGPC
jgi:hypothetical protein